VFDDGLAELSKQAFDPDDPSLGRVLSSRIFSPQAVGVFKRAVARLENIDISRLAALHFRPGDDIPNATAITADDVSTPGASPEQSLLLCCIHSRSPQMLQAARRRLLSKLDIPNDDLSVLLG